MKAILPYLSDFLTDLLSIINEMSPYLLLGFFFAGLLHVFFPKNKVRRYLGGENTSAVLNAALIGIPLPLCSCGVIPTGISFYKHGASKGSTVSFLISTPQTGIDSILVTYSLLGLPFALIRPVIALITGIAGGLMTNIFNHNRIAESGSESGTKTDSPTNSSSKNRFVEMFRYAFVEFMQDISKYLVPGLLVAAAISILIPDDFFSSISGNEFLTMLVVLIAAIPVYVCATASVPVAAILILKGLSPGAALVLLMAGPATNIATITLIHKVLGKISLFSYLITLTAGALLFGTLINYLPGEWFIIPNIGLHMGAHDHELLPYWLKISSSAMLILLILNGYIHKIRVSRLIREVVPDDTVNSNQPEVETKKILIKGMTCNHCRQKVENTIRSIRGIHVAEADISTGKVVISGDPIDLAEIKTGIERLGYGFEGEID